MNKELDDYILEKLHLNQIDNPAAPANLFRSSFQELIKLGYKKLKAEDVIENGDLLDAAGEELWVIIYNAQLFQKTVKRKEVGVLNILRK